MKILLSSKDISLPKFCVTTPLQGPKGLSVGVFNLGCGKCKFVRNQQRCGHTSGPALPCVQTEREANLGGRTIAYKVNGKTRVGANIHPGAA